MTYIINKTNNKIVEYLEEMGAYFRSDAWRECTEEELTNYQLDKLREEKLPSRYGYLDSTDWYIIRKIERGINIPKNITADRLKALKEIDNITLLNSVDELEKISNNFEKTEV